MDAEDFVLQEEEVAAVRWCGAGRLRQMVSEGTMYNYGDAYYRMLFAYVQKGNRTKEN